MKLEKELLDALTKSLKTDLEVLVVKGAADFNKKLPDDLSALFVSLLKAINEKEYGTVAKTTRRLLASVSGMKARSVKLKDFIDYGAFEGFLSAYNGFAEKQEAERAEKEKMASLKSITGKKIFADTK